jgi:small subunit ribosomal protein S20
LEDFDLANTASAAKRVRSNARKAARNKVIRTRARTMVRKARAGLEEQDPAAARAATLAAIAELDRAASKGIIHKNNASRRKGRLMKALAALEKQA